MNSERDIRGTLKRLTRQRVALVLQPGGVWVIDNAVEDTEKTDAALKTAYMRGWVEPLANAVPAGCLKPDGRLPEGPLFDRMGQLWKLTDSGWAIVNRSHGWTLFAVLISALSLVVAIAALVVAIKELPA